MVNVAFVVRIRFDEQDSGWSVSSGHEDDDFLNNPDNLQYIPIGVILNIDESILSFIEEPPSCAYERNDEYLFYKKYMIMIGMLILMNK